MLAISSPLSIKALGYAANRLYVFQRDEQLVGT